MMTINFGEFAVFSSHFLIFHHKSNYLAKSQCCIGVAIRIRIRNPNPTPFLDKKHNPHPNPNPQFKLRIRIVEFFFQNATYKILLIINTLICCKFFSYAGSHRKFTSKSNKSRLKLIFTVAFMLILGYVRLRKV